MKKFALVTCLFLTTCAVAQDKEALPISTQTLLNGVASPQSKSAIKSVLMIVCPKDGLKGTGFVLTGGNVIATNSHVVATCAAQELIGHSAVTNEQVRFTTMRKDENRDLAILCLSKPLPYSLSPSGNEDPPVETDVETWGYPLSYEGFAPLLSRGYIAGYNVNIRQSGAAPVKRLIVNGALNPGNSGGPLIDRHTGKVVGIVVEKWRLWSPNIEVAIQGFSRRPAASFGSNFVSASGEQITNEQMLGVVIKEFYDKSQVMIGEAISVSELNAFLKEKQKDLGCSTPKN